MIFKAVGNSIDFFQKSEKPNSNQEPVRGIARVLANPNPINDRGQELGLGKCTFQHRRMGPSSRPEETLADSVCPMPTTFCQKLFDTSSAATRQRVVSIAFSLTAG